ncbi:PEP-CTERM sorting domain-containing protein [Denitrobaculum tricleocarpae]|uniref:PEP-CTERM sorting domain-containing protein n=1 Tax=Denitrobaculum tricleocarpae TaxID=2591009 RepID=A0A545SXQ3_9PROT|nr:PEP-CTERM sorting domain-containing protein [Denitrobaculum tricleocarpae]
MNAFGIDIADFGSFKFFSNTLRVSIDGDEFFDVFKNFRGADGNELFLGLFDEDSSFTSVTFAATTRLPDFIGFDRLQYGLIEATPVSEPATLALFGLGLAGLGVLRRRKSRARA